MILVNQIMERYLVNLYEQVLVEAKFQGGSEWYQGKIISINTENVEKLYSIQYQDGEIEDNVTKDKIKHKISLVDIIIDNLKKEEFERLNNGLL